MVFPKSKAESAYLSAIDGRIELFSSTAILTEVATVLQSKFDWPHERITQILLQISNTAAVKRTKIKFHVLADEPDNRILECADAVGADYIVTGDKQMLALKNFHGVRVISLSEFIQIIG